MAESPPWWEDQALLDAADAAELAGYRARLGEVVELAESALRGAEAGAETTSAAEAQAARAALAQARAWFEDAEAAGPPSGLRVLAGLRRGLVGAELVDFLGRGRSTAVAAAGSEVDRG